MELFDLFKPKPKSIMTEDNSEFAKMMKENYEETKKEIGKLQAANAAWEKDFYTLLNFRTTASAFEKDGKLYEAIDEYIKSISFGVYSQRLNLSNYAHDIERLIVLYNKTKQKETLVSFLEQLIAKYPDYRDIQKWAVRLSSLTQTKSKATELNPSDINKQYPSNPTIGEKLQTFIETFPKFNFYFDMPEGMDTWQYLSIRKPVPFEKSVELRKFKEAFETILNRARIAENENNLKVAIEAYEKLVVEECVDTEPYERLMIIYRKLAWTIEEKRIIRLAIDFFSKLKETQKNKILCLAREFNMENKALEYININKKIFYYGGAFELYNPLPIIDKWNERLLKTNLKTK